jgi:hypothetical protein
MREENMKNFPLLNWRKMFKYSWSVVFFLNDLNKKCLKICTFELTFNYIKILTSPFS